MQIVKLIDPKTLNRFLCCQQGYKPVMVDGHLILQVKLPVVDTMDSSLNDRGLQGIMVAVVIKTNIQSKMMLNIVNYYFIISIVPEKPHQRCNKVCMYVIQPQGGYSGFQVMGMIEGFFWV